MNREHRSHTTTESFTGTGDARTSTWNRHENVKYIRGCLELPNDGDLVKQNAWTASSRADKCADAIAEEYEGLSGRSWSQSHPWGG